MMYPFARLVFSPLFIILRRSEVLRDRENPKGDDVVQGPEVNLRPRRVEEDPGDSEEEEDVLGGSEERRAVSEAFGHRGLVRPGCDLRVGDAGREGVTPPGRLPDRRSSSSRSGWPVHSSEGDGGGREGGR